MSKFGLQSHLFLSAMTSQSDTLNSLSHLRATTLPVNPNHNYPPEPPDPPDPPDPAPPSLSPVSTPTPPIVKPYDFTVPYLWSSSDTLFAYLRFPTAVCRPWYQICSQICSLDSAPIYSSTPFVEPPTVDVQANSIGFGVTAILLDQISLCSYALIYSCLLSYASDYGWVFDAWVGLVLLEPSSSVLIPIVSVDFGSRYDSILLRIEVFTSVYLVYLVDISHAFVRPITAICRLCSLNFGNFVSLGIHCLDCSVTEHILLMFPFMMSGLIVGIFVSKVTIASINTLFNGSARQSTSAFVAYISIIYAVLVTVSISGIRSLSVLLDSQSIVLPLSNNGIEFFHGFSCLSVWLAFIYFFNALCFAFVALFLLALMTLFSWFVNIFSFDGE